MTGEAHKFPFSNLLSQIKSKKWREKKTLISPSDVGLVWTTKKAKNEEHKN